MVIDSLAASLTEVAAVGRRHALEATALALVVDFLPFRREPESVATKRYSSLVEIAKTVSVAASRQVGFHSAVEVATFRLEVVPAVAVEEEVVVVDSPLVVAVVAAAVVAAALLIRC